MTGDSALVLSGVRRTFGSTLALDNASVHVRRGTVHALLGENGAGKTTLMRIAFGLLSPDRGTISVEGRECRFRSTADAIATGIGMVHQHFLLVPALTATENAALGGRGRLMLPSASARLAAVAKSAGLAVDPGERVSAMAVGAQQRLEILRALAHESRILILDEPTAVLTPDEGAALLAWIRQFVDGGGTAVLITHKLREALSVADDVTVLRRGRTVLARPAAQLLEEDLVAAVTGGGAGVQGAPPARVPAPAGAPVLELRGVRVVDARGVIRLHDASLAVHQGEVLGVVGVEGAGHRELLRVLAGREIPSGGVVRRPARIGYVPEDRLGDALIGEMSLVENLALAEAGAAQGRLSWPELALRTGRMLADADVRADGPNTRALTLSGGNQQKFVVARERALAESALVAENPTRGLDIRASARVLDELRAAADRSRMAVVVYSPDLDEVLGIADRVVVCFEGRLQEVTRPADPTDRGPYARAMLGAA